MTSHRERPPRICVTLGDPAGIGPEVVAKALSDQAVRDLAEWVIVGSQSVLEQAAREAGVTLNGPRIFVHAAGTIEAAQVEPGRVSAACGEAALDSIRSAVRLCLSGETDAMVTAPVNKEAVNLTGEQFSGHTEFLAKLCDAAESRMMLVNDRLRVVHVTTHVSLRHACEIKPERVLRTLLLGRDAVRTLGIVDPRVAVCGLNPHAGEHGLFGTEDADSILPAVEQARLQGLNCEGPLPADTVFHKALQGKYDLVIAMYHDQGHIPIKMLDFEGSVNVSLGLPIIRTSVDHGTAFDIAGKNSADARNMKAAMGLAVTMARNPLPKAGTAKVSGNRRL